MHVTTHTYIISNAYYVLSNINMKYTLVNRITGIFIPERNRQHTCKYRDMFHEGNRVY